MFYITVCFFPLSPTSACHRHHRLGVIRSLQTEALDGSEHRDHHVGLVWRTASVISAEFEPSRTGAAEQATGTRQTQLLTRPHVITAAVRRAC